MLNCSEKCPELSGYFYPVQNLLLLYFISKVSFLPYWRVEIQKMCFCAWEECFALGMESKGVTCVPLSPYQSVVYCHGGRIGFFQGDIRLLSDDMKALRPTIFPVVPRLLNRMYDKVSWILILLFLEPWSLCPFTMWKNSLSYGDFSSRLYYFCLAADTFSPFVMDAAPSACKSVLWLTQTPDTVIMCEYEIPLY